MGFDKTDDLFKAEPLVDALLAYHLIPVAYSTEKLTQFAPFTIKPFKGGVLRFSKEGAKVTIVGEHNSALIVKAGLDAGRSVVHTIDAVLMPETVFFTIMDALEFYSSTSILQNMMDTTPDLTKAITDAKTNVTVFAPRNDAFLEMGPGFIDRVMDDAATRTAGLSYHVATGGGRYVPQDFKDGEVLQTLLKGETLSIRIEAVEGAAGKAKEGRVLVVPSGGKPGIVQVINIVAGRSVIHGIDRVLVPKKI